MDTKGIEMMPSSYQVLSSTPKPETPIAVTTSPTSSPPDRLPVLYCSDNYLVVDKPCDMLINSDDVTRTDTVHRILSVQFPQLVDTRLAHGFRFCHRLDYSTSGVLCVALNRRAAALAGRAFETRATIKEYVALLRGHLDVLRDSDGGEMTVSVAIGTDSRPDHQHRMCTADEPHCGPPRFASTRIRPVAHGTYDDQPATKVHLVPLTGRRHQLRLHSRAIGHPIVGDFTYSEGRDVAPPRMFLHAYRLRLDTGLECVNVTASDPLLDAGDGRWIVTRLLDDVDHHHHDSNYLE